MSGNAENPEATEEEQEAAHEQGRQQEEEGMRYPGHEDPDAQRERVQDDDGGDDE